MDVPMVSIDKEMDKKMKHMKKKEYTPRKQA